MGTYAPKSPDLSSFYSAGPTSEAPASAPQSETGAQRQQLPSQQSPSQFSPHQQRVHLQPPTNTYFPYFAPPAGQPVPQAGPGYSVPRQSQKLPLNQSYDTSYQSPFPVSTVQFYGHGSSAAPSTPAPSASPGSGQVPPESFFAATKTLGPAPGSMPPKRGGSSAAGSSAAASAVEPSPVRTKFPTARIKRIMQADEEVGKVAQQTPIAVGKALEMFMVALVTKSADVAREKNSKRVSAQMLKQVVESDDQWDFLRDIVGRVENEEKGGAKSKAAKAESESEEEQAEKKKRAGRKRKAA